MSTFGSDASYDFLDYARRQHDLGVELVLRHAPEATGCCRTCGRVFPCDGYEDGQHMRAHYVSYLPDLAPTEVTPTDLPRLGRADGVSLAEPQRAPEFRFGV